MVRLAILLLMSGLTAGEIRLDPAFSNPHTGDLLQWSISGIAAADDDLTQAPRLEFTGSDGRWVRSAVRSQDHQANDHATPEPVPVGELVPVGEPRLIVRHTVRTAGLQNWRLLDSAGSLLANGELNVVQGAGPGGPLRISPRNSRLLSFADGTPFIPIGPNIAWANAPGRLERFERYFTKLSASGGTHVRIWLASWCGQVASDIPGRYRLDQAWQMDRVLALARSQGLRVTLVIDNHHDLALGHQAPYGGAGADRDARLKAFFSVPLDPTWTKKIAWMLARWGADDTIAAWELANEPDLAEPVRDRTLPWITAAAAFLKKMDADHRLITASWAGIEDWERVLTIPGIDLGQIHAYVLEWDGEAGPLRFATRDGVGMMEASAARAVACGKPFYFGEVGYQGTNERNPGNDIDGQGLLLRQQAWAGLLAGGCGSGMAWWWDNHIDKQDLWHIYRGLAAVSAQVDWADRNLAPLPPGGEGEIRVLSWQSPDQALLWVQPRADTWYAHLVQGRPRQVLGQTILIRLTGMRPKALYAVRTLGMATGSELAKASATASATGTLDVPVAPRQLDSVLKIDVAK